jgi:ABC-type nitrate/sulfonate/bicarbonate transport system substrate-binding protein
MRKEPLVQATGWSVNRVLGRRVTRIAVLAAVLLSGAFGWGSTGFAAHQSSTLHAPTIPMTTVTFSYTPCCADLGMPSVAVERGFFKAVGVNISPAHGYQYPNGDNVVSSMSRGDYDVTTYCSICYLSVLNTYGKNLPATSAYSIYIGYTILLSPDNHAKTTLDYMKQGMSFPAAAKKAVQEIKGQEVYTPPVGTTQPPFPNVMLSYGGLTINDLKLHFLDDTKTAELAATPGRVKWAIPYNAPVTVELIDSGWKPLINVAQILQNDPHSSQAHQLGKLVGDAVTVTQRPFLASHRAAVERFISAIFRAVDYLTAKKTQMAGFRIVANIVNATQGTKLKPTDIGYIYKNIDPLFTWKQQPLLWNIKSSPYYVSTALSAQVQSLVANKTIPKANYDLNRFMAAAGIYKQMAAQQKQADKLFRQTSSITGAKKAWVARAHQLYTWHDYLDAVRFLKAALA